MTGTISYEDMDGLSHLKPGDHVILSADVAMSGGPSKRVSVRRTVGPDSLITSPTFEEWREAYDATPEH